jgi:predicted GH43/DUF377 family glycosyl hydrolase
MFIVKRSKSNPIIAPIKEHAFENFSTFNGNPIEVGKKIHLLYRAQSLPESFENNRFSLSVIGKATSTDGINFENREQFIFPEHIWERFGLEDPRVTKIGGKYYIFYTALSIYPFSGDGIKVGLAISSDMKTPDYSLQRKGHDPFSRKNKRKIYCNAFCKHRQASGNDCHS